MAWFQTVQNAVYDALCAVFGVDPAAQSSLNRFIPAYTPGITVPQFNSNDNVCFYAVSLQQGTSSNWQSQECDKNKIVVTKPIPIAVLLTFYGPNAEDDSEFFWSNFFVDTGKGSARSILRRQRIVPAEKPDRPVSAPELEGTLWRRRCDLRLSLCYLDIQTIATQTVIEPPAISINTAE